ncbi:hypothetical protein Fmac_016161 [Flemingia macrophylla]|uniref:Pectinesterase inhibitor domain-containing protein n=1 Tax=Flemingia macrophylla TaxID=520843 RepID=A0ABD1MGM1_9FABA
MTSSTLPLLFFTISLILILHAPLPTLGTNFCETICDEAGKDEARCLEILKVDPKMVKASSYAEISKLILKLGEEKAASAQKALKEIMKTNPSPAIAECATTFYDGVVASFKSSLGELKVDALTANYDAKVAGDGPTTCDKALASANIVNPSISTLNKDILLISKLAFIATNKIPQTA